MTARLRHPLVAVALTTLLLLAACGNPTGVQQPQGTPDAVGTEVAAGPLPGPSSTTTTTAAVPPTFVPTGTATAFPPTVAPTTPPPTVTSEPATPTMPQATQTVPPATATITPISSTATNTATLATTPTVESTEPAQTGLPAAGGNGKIFYLAADGETINTIRPDGSEVQHVITVDKRPGEVVTNLSGEATGTFLIYSVGLPYAPEARYFLVHRGRAEPLPPLVGIPRWSPDGRRFVGQSYNASGVPGPIYLYDTADGAGRNLPVAGPADWFPDGKRLVYVADNVYSFDLASNTSTQLTDLPGEGDEAWIVQEAHVLPDAQQILFYGGQQQSVGASGNGQQWWTIPATGGVPQAFSELGGNSVLGYATNHSGDLLAYAESAHSSACLSEQRITIAGTDLQGQHTFVVPVPGTIEQSATAAFFIQGFAWAPDRNQIAFALQPYRCPDAGTGPETSTPAIYVWDVPPGHAARTVEPRKLVDGAYPVWIR